MAKAQPALDQAEREHDRKVVAIQAEVEGLEKPPRAEDDRCEKKERSCNPPCGVHASRPNEIVLRV